MKHWCIQVAKTFFTEFMDSLHLERPIKIEELGDDFYFLSFSENLQMSYWAEMPLLRYVFPVTHRWPVVTGAADFIERGSQGLFAKYGKDSIQNIQTFCIEQGLKVRTKNLRGRLLQVFDKKLEETTQSQFKNWRQNPVAAPVDAQSLVVCLRPKEVFAGCVSPRDSGSHFAGGRRFITQKVSRAGAKFVEASELLALYGNTIAPQSLVLELGAAPGGMTSQIASLGHTVIAVDRAPLAPEVLKLENVKFVKADARTLQLNHHVDLVVCDINGPCHDALEIVLHVARFLKIGGNVIFTLKLGENILALKVLEDVRKEFQRNGLNVLVAKHLYHNRHELTLLLKRSF